MRALWDSEPGQHKLERPKDFKCCPCAANSFSFKADAEESAQTCKKWVKSFVVPEFRGFCESKGCDADGYLPPSYTYISPEYYAKPYFYDAPAAPGKRYQYSYSAYCNEWEKPCPSASGSWSYQGHVYSEYPDFVEAWSPSNSYYYAPGSSVYDGARYGYYHNPYDSYYYGRNYNYTYSRPYGYYDSCSGYSCAGSRTSGGSSSGGKKKASSGKSKTTPSPTPAASKAKAKSG